MKLRTFVTQLPKSGRSRDTEVHYFVGNACSCDVVARLASRIFDTIGSALVQYTFDCRRIQLLAECKSQALAQGRRARSKLVEMNNMQILEIKMLFELMFSCGTSRRNGWRWRKSRNSFGKIANKLAPIVR